VLFRSVSESMVARITPYTALAMDPPIKRIHSKCHGVLRFCHDEIESLHSPIFLHLKMGMMYNH
jgi:hypothetical protein